MVTGAAASRWGGYGLNFIHTQTEVLQTASMLRKEWQLQVESAAARSCTRNTIKKSLAANGFTLVSFERIALPHMASHSSAFRFVASMKQSKLKVLTEVVVLMRVRTKVEMNVTGDFATRASIAPEARRLARLLESRIKA